MNRADTRAVRWLVLWLTVTALFLGAEWAWRWFRQRRRDREWAAGIAARVAARAAEAEFLRWLEDHWDDDAGLAIPGSEGDAP